MNEPESKAKGGGWCVIRQDTNGVRCVEARDLAEEVARAFAGRREEEIGSHHQTVWAEPMSGENGRLMLK